MVYKPAEPFTVRAELLNPTYERVKGVTVTDYKPVDYINCSFKTYGGTEQVINDVLTVVDTANVETWYRDDITSASRLKIGSKEYEILGEPENVSMRNQFLKFKVRAVRGGA